MRYKGDYLDVMAQRTVRTQSAHIAPMTTAGGAGHRADGRLVALTTAAKAAVQAARLDGRGPLRCAMNMPLHTLEAPPFGKESSVTIVNA